MSFYLFLCLSFVDTILKPLGVSFIKYALKVINFFSTWCTEYCNINITYDIPIHVCMTRFTANIVSKSSGSGWNFHPLWISYTHFVIQPVCHSVVHSVRPLHSRPFIHSVNCSIWLFISLFRLLLVTDSASQSVRQSRVQSVLHCVVL